MANLTFLFCILLVFTFVSGYDRTVTQGRVESCRGCSLNRLPEVKQFIYSDLPHYEKVEFMPIHGAPPELVLLSSAGEEVHRLPLSRLTRLECNELLETHGFKKSLPEAEVEEPPAKSEF